MGYHSAVVGVFALAAFASASIGDNTLESGERTERVVLVSPVLAPFQDSKVPSSVRARQFPILVLLAQANPEYSREQQAKSLEGNPQPIYVQKLEDQVQPQQEYIPKEPKKLHVNRQKRSPHHFKKHISWGGGGGGGCYSCGQPVVYEQPQVHYVQQPQVHYVQQPQVHYVQPPVQKTIVVKFEGGGHGGYGHGGGGGYGHGGGGGYGHGGGYGGQGGYGGGCGGNCGGGGGGYSQATATATATATAHAGGYGKK